MSFIQFFAKDTWRKYCSKGCLSSDSDSYIFLLKIFDGKKKNNKKYCQKLFENL